MKLPDGKFEIILADPPWHYRERVQHNGKETTGSAIYHYPTITQREMQAIQVKSIARDNALLFMWTTGPMLAEAITLGPCWGFTYKTVAFVWTKGVLCMTDGVRELSFADVIAKKYTGDVRPKVKTRKNPGSYTMSECEFCLVFKRGTIPKPRGSRSETQFVLAQRRAHSQKPDDVHERIEAMFPTQSKIELFARRERPGWVCWGNEVQR